MSGAASKQVVWRTLRAAQWRHFLLLPAAAIGPNDWRSRRALGRVAIASAATFAALAYAYGLNAVTDRHADRSTEKNPLAGADHLPPGVIGALAGAAATSVGLAAILGKRSVLRALTSLAAATVYSAGPRLKALPFAGTTLNTAIFTPLLGLALPGGAKDPAAFGALSSTLSGLLIQNQLLHEAADLAEDEASGVRSSARAFGGLGTRLAAAATAIPAAISAVRRAPSARVALAAVAALSAGSLVAIATKDPAIARKRHRSVALLGGAIVFAAGLFR